MPLQRHAALVHRGSEAEDRAARMDDDATRRVRTAIRTTTAWRWAVAEGGEGGLE